MKCKLFAAAMWLVPVLVIAPTCFGQTPITPSIVAVGSSGVFNSMAVAAATKDPITGAGAPCGSSTNPAWDGVAHVWTQGKGATTVAGIDGRSNSIPAEPGNIWVVWAQTTTGQPLVVCAYLTVDSVVGDRLFFSQHENTVNGGQSNGTLLLNPGSAGGNCQVPFLQDDGATCSPSVTAGTALPLVVLQSLAGYAFNVVFTDIRPEDAEFANVRAQCQPANAAVSCMGYGPFPVGAAVESSYSLTSGVQTSAQVVEFAELTGSQDPISFYLIPAYETTAVGADPMMVFVNKTDTNAGGFGTLYASGGNTQSHTLALVFSGLLGLTTDVSGTPGVTGEPLKVILREPTSGTYNAFEWQIPRAKGTDYSQELGLAFTSGAAGDCRTTWIASPSPTTYALPPAGNLGCVDPLYVAGPNGSSRTRGIGTGEDIKAVNANPGTPAVNPDSIGYAFWGFGNFAGMANIKYLTVDGVDPLGPSGGYTGTFPTCTGYANLGSLSCPVLSFAGIKEGAYRSWNVIHAAFYTTLPNNVNYLSPAAVPGLIQATQDQAASNTVDDFVPYVYCLSGSGGNCTGGTTSGLPVFRSHYFVSGANEANGTHGEAEAGGDMLGAIFNVQSDVDYFNATGTEIFEFLQ